jgi:cysteine desulfurase/selenocysteine lyase
MPPWQGGGDMILTVSFEKTTYNALPAKFEAGTPNISGAVGLAAAMDYVEGLGFEAISAHEQHLVELATRELERIPGVELVGTAAQKASIVSFVMEGVHPHDLGTILDHEGVAVRTGHHCAMPLMTFLGLPATVRASFACYNTVQDVASLVAALGKAREVFG